jgi:Holliday junction resolvasome RuvABC endonuclease subunit
MSDACILALDASSTTIGYCFYDGAVLASGEIALKDIDIAVRCRLAFAHFNGLLELYSLPDVIAIESPVARFGSAVIAQARVSGALLCAASLKQILVVEVAPQLAKKALTGRGNADKAAMMAVAWERYGVRGEHASDALGVALAAVKRVSVERQVA